jgi:DNA-binding transcriptional LysR family regulator
MQSTLCKNASMSSLNWDDLRVFLAVARAGRVAAAARKLGVEHSTVARRIAALERDVGAALFYRTAGGYQLTPHGTSALAGAETMERGMLGLGVRLREQSGDLVGRVRVALLDELASHWLAPNLPAFCARFPGLELQVVSGIAPLDLARGEAEIAVRSPRPRQTGLSAVRLARMQMGLYASRAYAAGKRLRVDASSRGLDLLVYLPAFMPLQNAPWFQPVLASSRVVMVTNSTHALLAAARAGAGIAVLARFMAPAYPELLAVSEDVSLGDDMWLVTHPEFRRDSNVRAVAGWLREIGADLT